MLESILGRPEQLAVDAAATEHTSTDPDEPTCVSSTDAEAASTDEPNPSPAAVQDTFDAAESPRRLTASLDDIIDSDHLSLLPDALLGNIVSRLPLKDAARTAVLSRCWRPLCAAPSVSLVCSDPIFPMLSPMFAMGEISDIDDFYGDATADELFCRTTQEGKLTIKREKV